MSTPEEDDLSRPLALGSFYALPRGRATRVSASTPYNIDMRLLLFSDIHCDLAAAKNLVELSTQADVAIGAGDFAVMHQGLVETLAVIREIACPTVLVPGNGERFDALREACAEWSGAAPLHGSGTSILGQAFYGLGGGVPVTPFGDWSYDFTEEEASSLLEDCPVGAVLVSHSPPLGAVDRDSDGVARGSTAVRESIVSKKPALVVCGHIHACWEEQETIGETPIVNAGPRGLLWDLDAGEIVNRS